MAIASAAAYARGMLSLALLLAAAAPSQQSVGQPGAGEVIEVSSARFRLVTDLSREEAGELMEKLETMINHVQRYWGRRLPKPIDMYVARDLSTWPERYLSRMAPDGALSIRNGGGLTIRQTARLGTQWDSRCIVYATSERGTAQHEAVHAYCGLAFGETGPVWYAEGMAEVGQYWRASDPAAVHAHDVVIDYLKGTEPKSLNELTSLNQQTGDSWQNYASRWALCHLLGFNPNYQRLFKPLGLQMLAGKPVTFEDAYGPQKPEIAFEYGLFLEHLCQGYRADLCAWNWRIKPRVPRSRGTMMTVEAKRGWQPQAVRVEAGTTYAIAADGEWGVGDAAETTADGLADGRGRLVGAIFDPEGYELGEPFALGADVRFTPEQSGQLVLRCRDDWGAIADNDGKLKVKLTVAE